MMSLQDEIPVRKKKAPRSREGISRRVLLVFLVIVLLTTIQLAWWIAFQIRYTGVEVAGRIERLQFDCHLATELMVSRAKEEGFSDDLARDVLFRAFPSLTWNSELSPDSTYKELIPRGRVIVAPELIEALHQQRLKQIRMFISEGVVFLLALSVGVLIIYRTLNRQVLLKRQQSNFLAAVTHELKSPLASIRLMTETLARLSLAPEKQREYQNSILMDVDRLSGLVNNILSVARIESGREGMPAVQTDLAREVVCVCDSLRESFVERGVQLELEVPDSPVRVRTDPEALQTAVRNLLENAAKYGGVCPVKVKVSVRGKLAELEVQDDGIGLSREDCERVFEKFYRVGDEMVRHVAGSGLGLYLVKALIEEYGGVVKASSEGQGKGARFVVTLPLDLRETG